MNNQVVNEAIAKAGSYELPKVAQALVDKAASFILSRRMDAQTKQDIVDKWMIQNGIRGTKELQKAIEQVRTNEKH